MAKKSTKKFFKWTIISVVALALVFFGYSYFTDKKVFENIFGQPQSCTETPGDPLCVCPLDKTKKWIPGDSGTPGSMTCVDPPVYNNPITAPLETWEEAIAYTEQQVGTNAHCTGDLIYRNPLTGATYDTIGNTFLVVECSTYQGSDGVVTGGQIIYRMYFKKETGCIVSRACQDTYAPDYGISCAPDIGFDISASTCPLS